MFALEGLTNRWKHKRLRLHFSCERGLKVHHTYSDDSSSIVICEIQAFTDFPSTHRKKQSPSGTQYSNPRHLSLKESRHTDPVQWRRSYACAMLSYCLCYAIEYAMLCLCLCYACVMLCYANASMLVLTCAMLVLCYACAKLLLCYAMQCYAMLMLMLCLCYAYAKLLLCYAMLCLCYATLCLCYATLCYACAMLCLCYATFVTQ